MKLTAQIGSSSVAGSIEPLLLSTVSMHLMLWQSLDFHGGAQLVSTGMHNVVAVRYAQCGRCHLTYAIYSVVKGPHCRIQQNICRQESPLRGWKGAHCLRSWIASQHTQLVRAVRALIGIIFLHHDACCVRGLSDICSVQTAFGLIIRLANVYTYSTTSCSQGESALSRRRRWRCRIHN